MKLIATCLAISILATASIAAYCAGPVSRHVTPAKPDTTHDTHDSRALERDAFFFLVRETRTNRKADYQIVEEDEGDEPGSPNTAVVQDLRRAGYKVNEDRNRPVARHTERRHVSLWADRYKQVHHIETSTTRAATSNASQPSMHVVKCRFDVENRLSPTLWIISLSADNGDRHFDNQYYVARKVGKHWTFPHATATRQDRLSITTAAIRFARAGKFSATMAGLWKSTSTSAVAVVDTTEKPEDGNGHMQGTLYLERVHYHWKVIEADYYVVGV